MTRLPASPPKLLVEFLGRRDFGLFVSASLVSLVGDGLFRVAISLQVYALVREPKALASVAFAWALGQFLLLPVGGWASDRYSKRSLLVAADVWRGLAIGSMGVLSLTGGLTVSHMVVLGFCFGIGNAFFNPGATSFLPEIVDVEGLPRANALLGGLRPVMLYVVGPLAGGVVVSIASPGAAFCVDALTFATSAVLLARIRGRAGRPEVSAGDSPFRTALEGLRVVAGRRWLWVGMSAMGISALAYHGPFEVLVPFLLVSDFGQSQGEAAASLSWILAASGAGSVLTAWWIARRALPRRFLLVLYVGEAFGLLMLAVIGVMTAIWQAVLAGFFIGAMFALTEVIWTTTLQRHVPREALGRVSSLDWMLSVGVAPLSFAAAGLIGGSDSPRAALVGAGLVAAGVLVAASCVPAARRPERDAPALSGESSRAQRRTAAGTAASGGHRR